LNRERKKETKPTKSEVNNVRIQVLLTEKNFLRDVKKVVDTKEGKALLIWILKKANPLDDRFDGSSKTYYNLGLQYVGKKIIELLTEAECELCVTDISDKLSMSKNKLEMMDKEITRLKKENEEAKKDGRRNK
jgi:hypothetical protein